MQPDSDGKLIIPVNQPDPHPNANWDDMAVEIRSDGRSASIPRLLTTTAHAVAEAADSMTAMAAT